MRTHVSGLQMPPPRGRTYGHARFVCSALFLLVLFACIPAAHAWGKSEKPTLDAQALEDKFAEDFEAPIYKASQQSMDTAVDVEVERKAASAKARLAQRRRANLNAPPVFEWRFEGVGLLVVVAYVLNYLKGNAVNRQIARTFENAFLKGGEDSVFHREFSEVVKLHAKDPGPGKSHSKFSREAPEEYKCWCTGRRFVTGALITLKLKKRHDLAFLGYELSNPAVSKKDQCVVECFFNPGVIGPGFAFAIGDSSSVRNLESSVGKKDIARLCEKTSGPKDAAGRRRVSTLLTVKAESSELASDILTDFLLEKLFGEVAFKTSKAEKFLKTIHVATGEDGESSLTGAVETAFEQVKGTSVDDKKENGKKEMQNSGVVRFTFDLPSVDVGVDGYYDSLSDVVNLIPHLIDVVGRVRLSDTQKDKAIKARKRIADEDFKVELKSNAKENADKRLDAKLEAMSDKEKQKWREKQQKKQLRKGGGKSMIRKG